MIPPRIKQAVALDNFSIELLYETGERKIYDARKILKYSFFQKLNNIDYFKTVKCVQTTIEWPDGEDIDPYDLYKNSILID